MSDSLTKKMPGGSNGKLDELYQMVQAVRVELSDLRDTVNTRLYDTRPMWEKMEAGLTQLKTDVTELKTDVTELKTGVREIRTHQRDMNRRMSIFNDTLSGIQADYRDIYDRVREIERHQT